jgi:hypothetical protein
VCTGTALPVFRRAALCTTCFAREVRAVLVSADTATVLPGALRASPFTGTLRCYLACRSTMARAVLRWDPVGSLVSLVLCAGGLTAVRHLPEKVRSV